MSQTRYRLELARPGLWVLWADGERVGDTDRWEEGDVGELQAWACDVIQSRHRVRVEQWSGESPVFMATIDDSVAEDRDEHRRLYLAGESGDSDDPRARGIDRRLRPKR